MSWRLFLLLLLCALAMAANAALIATENMAPAREQAKATQLIDRHAGRVLTAAERVDNLRAWGFDEAQVKDVLSIITGLQQRYHMDDPQLNKLHARLTAAEDQNGLRTALCGVGAEGTGDGSLPIRYEAMKVLVTEKGGRRDALDLDGETLKYQGWVVNSYIEAIFKQAELVEKPHEDATRMAFAAIMAGSSGEREFLAHQGGWNDGAWGIGQSWSWDTVKANYPGVDRRVNNYAALLLLAAEDAHSATSTLCPS